MAVKNWNMELELTNLAKTKKAKVPAPFINKINTALKKLGNFTLESTLFELILSNELNEERFRLCEKTKSNNPGTESNNDSPISDEEMFAQVRELMDKESNPELAVDRSYDEEIIEIQSRYSRKIAPFRLYLPITEWDRSTVAYYCMQSNFDPQINDLLYFFFSPLNNNKGFNTNTLVDILDEFGTGFYDSLKLSDLISEKEFYSSEENKDAKFKSEFPTDVDSLMKFIKTALQSTEKLITDNNTTSSPKAPVPDNLTYFELNAKQENMKQFKLELEHAGYITKGLPLDVFRRVFLFKDDYSKDKIKQLPCKPIEWLANKSHLGYLIKQLSKNNIIIGKEYYKIAENCFIYNGEPIPNTVFHGMQLPAINAKKKLDRIALLLVEKGSK